MSDDVTQDDPLLRGEVNRSADEFVMAVYVLADATGREVGAVMSEAVRDARARAVEQGVLTEDGDA
jgi:hypothetical protein